MSIESLKIYLDRPEIAQRLKALGYATRFVFEIVAFAVVVSTLAIAAHLTGWHSAAYFIAVNWFFLRYRLQQERKPLAPHFNFALKNVINIPGEDSDPDWDRMTVATKVQDVQDVTPHVIVVLNKNNGFEVVPCPSKWDAEQVVRALQVHSDKSEWKRMRFGRVEDTHSMMLILHPDHDSTNPNCNCAMCR